MAKIVSCEPIGVEQTYDLELEHDDHQFFLSNDVLTSNSHAAAYISVSLQCAWLMYHYPEEWTAAYLDAQGENKKEHAISVARNAGFEIAPPDINHSTDKWLIKDSETLVQPLTDVKKCGQKAYEQIKEHRPFEDPERVVLDDDIDHRPLSKNVVGNLIKVGALDELIENKEQINGRKHLWASLVEDKPSSEKMYNENLEEYDSLSDFQKDTQIEYDLDLTGVYPYDKILQDEVFDKLDDMGVEGITEFESDQEQEAVVWFVVHEVREEIASSGNKYWVLDVSDNSGQKTDIRCWSPKEYEEINENCAYLGKLDYDPKWGFSCNSIYHNIEEI